MFTAIELDKRDDCADIQAALGEMTGATSVIEWENLHLMIQYYNSPLIISLFNESF